MDALGMLVTDPTSLLSVVEGIKPDNHAASTVTGSAIDTNLAPGIHVFYDVGTVAAGASVIFKMTKCATSGGSYTDVTGATTASITATTSGVATADWSGLNNERFIKIVATVAVDTVDCACFVMLTGSKTMPNPL